MASSLGLHSSTSPWLSALARTRRSASPMGIVSTVSSWSPISRQQASIRSGQGIASCFETPGLLRISGAVDWSAIHSFHLSSSASNDRRLTFQVQALSARFRNGEWIAAIDSLIGWEHTSTAVIRSERPTAPPTTRGEPIRWSISECPTEYGTRRSPITIGQGFDVAVRMAASWLTGWSRRR